MCPSKLKMTRPTVSYAKSRCQDIWGRSVAQGQRDGTCVWVRLRHWDISPIDKVRGRRRAECCMLYSRRRRGYNCWTLTIDVSDRCVSPTQNFLCMTKFVCVAVNLLDELCLRSDMDYKSDFTNSLVLSVGHVHWQVNMSLSFLLQVIILGLSKVEWWNN